MLNLPTYESVVIINESTFLYHLPFYYMSGTLYQGEKQYQKAAIPKWSVAKVPTVKYLDTDRGMAHDDQMCARSTKR